MNIDQIFQDLNIKGELVSVDLGTVVFNQGQSRDHLYVVKSGRLRVLKEENEEGQVETVGYLYAGKSGHDVLNSKPLTPITGLPFYRTFWT